MWKWSKDSDRYCSKCGAGQNENNLNKSQNNNSESRRNQIYKYIKYGVGLVVFISGFLILAISPILISFGPYYRYWVFYVLAGALFFIIGLIIMAIAKIKNNLYIK